MSDNKKERQETLEFFIKELCKNIADVNEGSKPVKMIFQDITVTIEKNGPEECDETCPLCESDPCEEDCDASEDGYF